MLASMEVANELMVRGIVVGVFQENCWTLATSRTKSWRWRATWD